MNKTRSESARGWSLFSPGWPRVPWGTQSTPWGTPNDLSTHPDLKNALSTNKTSADETAAEAVRGCYVSSCGLEKQQNFAVVFIVIRFHRFSFVGRIFKNRQIFKNRRIFKNHQIWKIVKFFKNRQIFKNRLNFKNRQIFKIAKISKIAKILPSSS